MGNTQKQNEPADKAQCPEQSTVPKKQRTDIHLYGLRTDRLPERGRKLPALLFNDADGKRRTG